LTRLLAVGSTAPPAHQAGATAHPAAPGRRLPPWHGTPRRRSRTC